MTPLWTFSLDGRNLIPLHRADRIFLDDDPNAARIRVAIGADTFIIWEEKPRSGTSLKNAKDALEVLAEDLNGGE